MPFGNIQNPSLGLSLLKSQLARVRLAADVRYLNLRFAERIGTGLFRRLATESGEREGEWVFSHCLFDEAPDSEERYLDEVLRRAGQHDAGSIQSIRRVREHALPFLRECVDSIDWSVYRIVGFTSSFQQHVASLGLARLIKQRYPATAIVLGGANCEGVMGSELLAQFPFVDYVCVGEGDLCFPRLAREIVDRGSEIEPPPGIVGRHSSSRPMHRDAPPIVDLDGLPDPDFGDYFDQLERSPLAATLDGVRLQVETARGCWWGQKQHCTFCGLNGLGMAFRRKSPQAALQQIMRLTSRYGARLSPPPRIHFTDNILDLGYLETLVPLLAKSGTGTRFFWETKANLTKNQLRSLREAGVDAIQPGIESLSTPVLRLMKKGSHAFQNVQLLKWCHELRIAPYWNILCGFPGEEPAHYDLQCRVVEQISHLCPPRHITRIALHRFSPYFSEPGKHGIINVRPSWVFRHIYPFSDDVLSRLIYTFDFDYEDGRDPAAYSSELGRCVARWQSPANSDFLHSIRVGVQLVIWDGRAVAVRPITVLSGLQRAVYELCDTARGTRSIREHLCRRQGVSPSHVREALRELVDLNLMLEEDGHYLSLAVPIDVRLGDARDHGTRPPAAGQLRPLRRPDLQHAEIDEGTLLFDRDRRELHILNHVAAAVLDLCDGSRCTNDIAAYVHGVVGSDLDAVRADVAAIVGEFVSMGLLVTPEGRGSTIPAPRSGRSC